MRQYGPAARENLLSGLPESTRPKKPFPVLSVMVISVVLVMAFGIYMTVFWWMDIRYGASSPEELAVAWVGVLTDRSDSGVLRYCVPAARRMGVLADTSGINETRALLSEYHVSFSGRSVQGVETLSDAERILLEKGMADLYNTRISVREAARVIVSATMEWLDSGGVPHSSRTEFRIVCVHVHGKWYVYTGAAISEADINSIDLDGDSDTGDEQVPVLLAPDVSYDPYTPVTKPLSPYDGARADLAAGKLTIEDVELTVPGSYAGFSGLFRIAGDSEWVDAILEPNMILNNVPIEMADLKWAAMGLSVGIANTGTEPAAVTEGLVTELYLSIPAEDYQEYPAIYLPGNVTFGTAYFEAIAVYGEMTAVVPDDDRFVPFSSTAAAYQITLGGNPHNNLYLQFEDDKLVAIQYDYFDFNEYSGDIA